jgi:dihydropteroate synthase
MAPPCAPFGVGAIDFVACRIDFRRGAFHNLHQPRFRRTFMTRRWQLAHGRHAELGGSALIMGILNVTPDSFSDGGRFDRFDAAIAQAERMIAEGADIIDIGGESTKPGAVAISANEEQRRVLPVIERLASEHGVLLSVDTYREETARLAVAAGVHIVNDVWGLQREAGIARVAAGTGAGLVIMHTGRDRQKLADVIEDQRLFLTRSLEIAREAGVPDAQIVLDPGFGFAKNPDENLAVMARFAELRSLGYPLAVGTSRKRFVGHVTGRDGDERDIGTAATSAILRMKGAVIFRVHNVAINRDALAFADAMLERRNPAEER